MAKYQYGSFGFSRKSEVINHCRKILCIYPEGAKITDSAHHEFLLNLLLNHERYLDKIGKGMNHFTCYKMPPYNNKCFFVVRTDGSEIDFSFMQCISPSDHRKDVLQAMRISVSDQILAFKDDFFLLSGGLPVCPITGLALTKNNTHIDHASPFTFQDLADTFLESWEIKYKHVRLIESPSGAGSVFANRLLLSKWQEFHKSHARLRAVHRNANLGILKTNPAKQLTNV